MYDSDRTLCECSVPNKMLNVLMKVCSSSVLIKTADMSPPETLTLEQINTLDEQTFINTFSILFGTEHSHKVLSESYINHHPYPTIPALYRSIRIHFLGLPRSEILLILQNHQRLALPVANAGSQEGATSLAEQKRSGLLDLTIEEHEQFLRLTDAYETKHGFPFMLAIKGRDKSEILRYYYYRLMNDDTEIELDIAAGQLAKLVALRLENLVAGPINVDAYINRAKI
eukprot:TRINITY_DN10919_c0_g1_i1.p2 TRINITY_DN10919_c0_g1~~TRINITY_DN10919_c0_g1_i1.p2  ORF type:complete len:228 (-),score=41.98 TRINITY_DN10919_c0_g1_i1:17-700(-)